MSNPNKVKGSRWETALVTHFHAHGLPQVFQINPEGFMDEGDLGGLRSFVIEAKDHGSPDMHAFVRQAKNEAVNAGKPFGVAIVKKRSSPTEDALVLMDLATFTNLLQHIERLGGRA